MSPTMDLAPTEHDRIAQVFDHTPLRDDAFAARGLLRFMQYRDLGLRAATGGLMRAEHIRVCGPLDVGTGWHCHDLDFQLKGHVKFRTQEGWTVRLGPGDCAHLPALYRHDEFEFALDFEVLEITAPSEVSTIVGDDVGLQERLATVGRVPVFASSHDEPQAYKVGDGPSRFLAYRDPGVTAATGRRVNINLARNSVAGDSSTGRHYHTLSCQFIFVLHGWSKVEVEGQGEFTLRAGDAMTIPQGVRHDVTSFSADFSVLELNLPADYATIACDASAPVIP